MFMMMGLLSARSDTTVRLTVWLISTYFSCAVCLGYSMHIRVKLGYVSGYKIGGDSQLC